MSPAEHLFWLRVQRRAASLQPDVARAMLRGFQQLREGLNAVEVEQLIRTSSVERLLTEHFDQASLDRAFAAVRVEVRGGVEDAARAFGRDLPRTAQIPGIAFDVLNPKVVEGIRELNTRVITTLSDATRETVRAYVENGIRDGVGPRTIARNLRSTIGLAPNQEQAVRNFRRALEGQPGARSPTDYVLRDRRFDRTLARLRSEGGTLPSARVDAMTEAYRKRMLAFHAETVSRTAALDSQRLGQRLTWQAAVDRGDIDGGRLFKRWAGVLDDRERDTHLAMEGETVPWDATYSNGQMDPGDDEWNCRCQSIFFQGDPFTSPRPGAGMAGVADRLVEAASLAREFSAA